jgi:hypothetical protein
VITKSTSTPSIGISTYELYGDGISLGAETSDVAWDDSDSIIIGSEENDQKFFNGLIDHVRIYNYARTPAQIAWDYNKGEPIAHWNFDECGGGTIYDESRRCKDGAGCNNGTLKLGTTGVTATGTCASSSSSTFWGSGSPKLGSGGGSFDGQDDWVDCNLIEPENITVAVWIKQDTAQGYNYPAFSKRQGTNIYSYSIYGSNGDKYYFRIYNGTGHINSPGISDSVIEGDWHQLVGTYDHQYVRLYVDGIEIGNGTAETNDIVYSTSYDTKIGAGRYYFNGLIDEVKIWNYALTSEQVRIEYTGGAVRFGE